MEENGRHPNTLNNSDEDTESPLDSQSGYEKYLLGFVLCQIVGIKHYNGKISGREMVALVREPLNAFDPNAIKVLNTRIIQVGYIEKIIASVLAPLIDQNLITVEGIVPNFAKGGVAKFKLPVQVHIFTRREEFNTVRSELSRCGLQLISQNDAGFGLSEAVVVMERSKGKILQQVDEIFKLVNEEIRKRALEKLEPPHDIIKSELLPHQKEGLGWLVYKETSNELPPFWEEKDGLYVNVLTNYQTSTRPHPLRGGILADDMGLGKTLTLLSLIAFDKQPTKNSRKRQKVEKKSLKTTLVVCPPSVISTWVTQLGDHTKPGSMKMYMYYGERTDDPKELQKYDIVLTTYATLVSEETWEESPIKKIEWWRLVLDEAHVIRNYKTQQSRVVANLNAKMRWAVTGTPIQNGFFDLFAFMTFLRFEPFSIRCYWRRLISRPLAQEFQLGLTRLQTLVATLSLRRTKEGSLDGLLPEKSIETCFVELSSAERTLYDQLEAEARVVVSSYISPSRVTNNYMNVLSVILRLRQICIDVAMCPADLKLLLPSEIEDVKNKPELLKKMVAFLQEGEDFDCPICMCPTTNMIITCCAHLFCKACILKTLKDTRRACPMCRHPLSESDLFSAPQDVSDNNGPIKVPNSKLSSKVSQLLKLLIESRNENPSRKSVIFSQFRKMLIMLEEPLREAGFKFLRLDGSMNAKKRGEIIKEFSMVGGATVLLASLKASGVGINLTVASRVYFLEPWWNPAVEEQAMDRVHRIGQTEKVKVVRLIAKNTIEERMVKLQEVKKDGAREAFQDGGGRIKNDHIRLLFSLK
ncbi:putative SWI/SNF-related matrix-associated actin-dependent regulator of chromatin subfamily A member 3-like 1 [Impatiens glandulifera]|uniref:putative SWI/SNF-related matrix-associated actin-dependent regulator of chromatin subfamily A member 3-like 1 n=1 Tax=Impatiens glandulifera TaxID=253017 RepID=UPI001FB077A2|nr:putative SWI/SNF-related matrix-associated actin-dependent regulator of chromatin subfamily A member 3-like 1 [Impatiens glandulifera]